LKKKIILVFYSFSSTKIQTFAAWKSCCNFFLKIPNE
jgi:hypothetical protein